MNLSRNEYDWDCPVCKLPVGLKSPGMVIHLNRVFHPACYRSTLAGRLSRLRSRFRRLYGPLRLVIAFYRVGRMLNMTRLASARTAIYRYRFGLPR